MGSCSCNLRCSYCYINKNKSFFNYDKNIKAAWQDGSYLDTIEQVYNKLNANPKDTTTFQLWGGEPTLYMPLIARWGKRIGNFLPNMNQLLIPTNWYKLDISALVDFIYNLDEGLAPRSRPEDYLNFHIQASIDGPGEFGKNGHDVPWEVYKNNYKTFCDCVKKKNKKLKNIHIIFTVCPTASQSTILSNFNTYEQISGFRTQIKEMTDYISSLIKEVSNASLILSSYCWVPRIAISQTTTTEEAVKLEPIVRLFDYCDFALNAPLFECESEIQSFRAVEGESSILSRNHECPESNEHSLTIMPDGTIAECPCTFLQNLDDYAKELLEQKNYWEYKSTLIRLPNFYNPLETKDSSARSDYHDWYVFNGYLGTNSTYANLNLSMGYEMALSKQIDPIYAKDPDLLIKHYLANFMTAECYREHVNVTHNHFLTDHNMFRRWYNGFTAYSYNDHYHKIKHHIQTVMEK